MTTKSCEGLEAKIERVLREHLAAQQKAARAAVERAFSSAAPPVRSEPARTGGRRRSTSEMTAIVERLFEAVRACPGELMTTIATRVGEAPRALNRPMHHLIAAGRVRSAGERNFTRYFPMAAAKSA